MNTEHISDEILADYIDYRTSAHRNRTIEAHLRICAWCRVAVELGRAEAGTEQFFAGIGADTNIDSIDAQNMPGALSVWSALLEQFAPEHEWLAPLPWGNLPPTSAPTVPIDLGSVTCTLKANIEANSASYRTLSVRTSDTSANNHAHRVILLRRLPGGAAQVIFDSTKRIEWYGYNQEGDDYFGFDMEVMPDGGVPQGEYVLALSQHFPLILLPFPPFDDARIEPLPARKPVLAGISRSAGDRADGWKSPGQLVLLDEWDGVRCELYVSYRDAYKETTDSANHHTQRGNAAAVLLLTLRASITAPTLIGRTMAFRMALAPTAEADTVDADGIVEFIHLFGNINEQIERLFSFSGILATFQGIAVAASLMTEGK